MAIRILVILFITINTSFANSAIVKELAKKSNEIVIVKVIKTKPRNAIEGARDTAKFVVLHKLKGELELNDKFGVYYHLLWIDIKTGKLEPYKFKKGLEYILFLTKSRHSDGANERIEYHLTDRWLSVQPVHPYLIKEITTE